MDLHGFHNLFSQSTFESKQEVICSIIVLLFEKSGNLENSWTVESAYFDTGFHELYTVHSVTAGRLRFLLFMVIKRFPIRTVTQW